MSTSHHPHLSRRVIAGGSNAVIKQCTVIGTNIVMASYSFQAILSQYWAYPILSDSPPPPQVILRWDYFIVLFLTANGSTVHCCGVEVYLSVCPGYATNTSTRAATMFSQHCYRYHCCCHERCFAWFITNANISFPNLFFCMHRYDPSAKEMEWNSNFTDKMQRNMHLLNAIY